MKENRSTKTMLARLNAIDGLIVLLICSTIFVAYLRFSEPYRVAGPGGEATGKLLQVELCMPPGYEWLLSESVEGFEERDPRSGAPSVRLLQVYLGSDSLIRVKAELAIRRDADGTIYFRDRPLVVGMKLRFDTSGMVVEGSLCRMGFEDEAQ